MAKKTKLDSSENSNLHDLLAMVQKVDPDAEILGDSATADVKEWIHTGSYIVNAAIAGSLFKGVPSGRVVVMAGESGAGKSFLMTSIARESQGSGYTPVIIDTENAIDNDFCKRLGVDTSNLIIKKCTTVSEMSNFVLGLCTKLEEMKSEDRPKIMLILDSLSNLSSDAEVENAESSNIHKQDFSKNRGLKAFFRTATTKLGRLGIPMLVSAHVYACLTEDNNIRMADGTLKSIKDVKIGDIVKTHQGEKQVNVVYTYDKANVLELEFEDGYTIKCTHNHPLLVNRDGKEMYIEAVDMQINDEIVCVSAYAKTVKLIKKTVLSEPQIVYDIEVEGDHNFILENGIVSSNSVGSFFPTNTISGGSGMRYSASTILMLSAAKLDGENKENDAAAKNTKAEITKTGVRVTARVDKSRFSIPTKVQFQIPFFKPMNPYVGLENFMTFENSGIGRGNIVTEKEYERAKPADKEKMVRFEYNGESLYFNPSDRARGMVVAHLGKQVPFTEFYTEEVFTTELLERLDKEIIRPTFELPTHSSNADIDEYLDLEDDEEVTTEN